jgi:hypothetical protein
LKGYSFTVSNFTILEYIGRAGAPVPFFGKATKTMYRFGGKIRQMAIDEGDVNGLLATYEGRQPAFRLVSTSLPIDEFPAAPEPVQVEQETAQVVTQALDVGTPTNEPFDFTILSGVGPARDRALKNACIETLQAFINAGIPKLVEVTGAPEKVVETWIKQLAS